jgi:hypothetical protein
MFRIGSEDNFLNLKIGFKKIAYNSKFYLGLIFYNYQPEYMNEDLLGKHGAF